MNYLDHANFIKQGNVFELMKETGYSFYQVEKMLEIPHSTFTNWKLGHTRIPLYAFCFVQHLRLFCLKDHIPQYLFEELFAPPYIFQAGGKLYNEDPYEMLSEWPYAIRKELGVKQQEIATMTGVLARTWQHWEHGTRRTPLWIPSLLIAIRLNCLRLWGELEEWFIGEMWRIEVMPKGYTMEQGRKISQKGRLNLKLPDLPTDDPNSLMYNPANSDPRIKPYQMKDNPAH